MVGPGIESGTSPAHEGALTIELPNRFRWRDDQLQNVAQWRSDQLYVVDPFYEGKKVPQGKRSVD